MYTAFAHLYSILILGADVGQAEGENCPKSGQSDHTSHTSSVTFYQIEHVGGSDKSKQTTHTDGCPLPSSYLSIQHDQCVSVLI